MHNWRIEPQENRFYMTSDQVSLICEIAACVLAAATSALLWLFRRGRRQLVLVASAFSMGGLLAALLIVGTFLGFSWRWGILFFSPIQTDLRSAQVVCPSAALLDRVISVISIAAALQMGFAGYIASKCLEPKELQPVKYSIAAALGFGFGVTFFALKFLL